MLSRLTLFRPRPLAILIDVGFTLTTYDADRIASLAAQMGAIVTSEAIRATEPRLRREMLGSTFAFRPDRPGTGSDGVDFFRRILALAEATIPGREAGMDRVAEHLWARHLERNVFREVLPGVAEALESLNHAGFKLAVVSNSEGTVDAMLDEVGLRPHLDTVVDSWTVGVSKPDRRIFGIALERIGVAPGDAVMVGDSLRADVEGAEAAGIRGALIDPYDLYPLYPLYPVALLPSERAPRFKDFASFAAAVVAEG